MAALGPAWRAAPKLVFEAAEDDELQHDDDEDVDYGAHTADRGACVRS